MGIHKFYARQKSHEPSCSIIPCMEVKFCQIFLPSIGVVKLFSIIIIIMKIFLHPLSIYAREYPTKFVGWKYLYRYTNT